MTKSVTRKGATVAMRSAGSSRIWRGKSIHQSRSPARDMTTFSAEVLKSESVAVSGCLPNEPVHPRRFGFALSSRIDGRAFGRIKGVSG